MIRRLESSPLAPWAGLFLGAAGWFAHHQLGADANMWSCNVGSGVFIVVLGLVCALVVLLGGLISWVAIAPDAEPSRHNHRFSRIVGVTAAAVFLLAIGFQTLAGVLVPACHR